MKIALIRPPAVECFRFASTSISLPLGLAYVAGALEAADHDVFVVDAVGAAPDALTRYYRGYLVGLSFDEIAARVPADAGLVGITVIFTHEWPAAVRLVETIKRARPGLPIVLGGEHVTSLPEFCLRTSRADLAVLGEGEETAVELADALASGRPLDGVDGLAFRRGGEVVVNPRRERRADVDAIAPPAWRHFDARAYHARGLSGGMRSAALTIPILATRGCPYRCTYCSSPNMWTTSWIPRDPARVVDEIERWIAEHGAGNFPLQDLTAVIRKDWIVAFCREIVRRGLRISWQLPTGTRSEAIDDEVAGLLRESGMVSAAYAPESGSETTRRLVRKRMGTERLFASVRAAARARLNVTVFLVVGFPHDEPAHLAENLPFLDRLAREGVADVAVGFYMALPGTELFDGLYDAGRIRLDREYFRHLLHNTALWPAQSYCGRLSRRDLALWKLRLFLRFYGERAPLWRAAARALAGLRGDGHRSKLQTAFRNGLKSARDAVRARFKPRWLPYREELEMFAGWDAVYRDVRRRRPAVKDPAAPATA